MKKKTIQDIQEILEFNCLPKRMAEKNGYIVINPEVVAQYMYRLGYRSQEKPNGYITECAHYPIDKSRMKKWKKNILKGGKK